jgi:tRNA(fMet)-specific endonuclease VapC
MEHFGRVRGALRQEGELIGDLDLLIGVTALHHHVRLLTCNRSHFDRIPGLELYPESS